MNEKSVPPTTELPAEYDRGDVDVAVGGDPEHLPLALSRSRFLDGFLDDRFDLVVGHVATPNLTLAAEAPEPPASEISGRAFARHASQWSVTFCTRKFPTSPM